MTAAISSRLFCEMANAVRAARVAKPPEPFHDLYESTRSTLVFRQRELADNDRHCYYTPRHAIAKATTIVDRLISWTAEANNQASPLNGLDMINGLESEGEELPSTVDSTAMDRYRRVFMRDLLQRSPQAHAAYSQGFQQPRRGDWLDLKLVDQHRRLGPDYSSGLLLGLECDPNANLICRGSIFVVREDGTQSRPFLQLVAADCQVVVRPRGVVNIRAGAPQELRTSFKWEREIVRDAKQHSYICGIEAARLAGESSMLLYGRMGDDHFDIAAFGWDDINAVDATSKQWRTRISSLQPRAQDPDPKLAQWAPHQLDGNFHFRWLWSRSGLDDRQIRTVYLLWLRRTATREWLHRHDIGVHASGKCPRCDGQETIEHLFLQCADAAALWNAVGDAWNRLAPATHQLTTAAFTTSETLLVNAPALDAAHRRAWRLVASITLFTIWEHRRFCLDNGPNTPISAIWQRTAGDIMQLQQARWHNDPAQFAAVQGVAQPFFQVSDDRRVKWGERGRRTIVVGSFFDRKRLLA